MRAEAAARKQGGRESVLKRRKILATSPHCQPLCKTEDARTRDLSNLCASCVRRERIEVEPPLGRARRRRTRHNGQGARTFHDTNIWGGRFRDFLGHIIYQNIPVMIYTRNKSGTPVLMAIQTRILVAISVFSVANFLNAATNCFGKFLFFKSVN